MTGFDANLPDSQATEVELLAPADFDFDAWEAREREQLERCRAFRAASEGILVHRRFRVGEVFSTGCRDLERSLSLQLGALQRSLTFASDVPNFLEPWYGVGTVAAAYGAEYVWRAGQAPAFAPCFPSVREALEATPLPVASTPIGRHTLAMVDRFLEATDGRLPLSLTDTQSPLSVAATVVDANSFLVEMLTDPEGVRRLLDRVAGLLVEFNEEQLRRIGGCAVWPGHGFASCRVFGGLGMSDDHAVMMSGEHYVESHAASARRVTEPYEGHAFHSCGNFASRLAALRDLSGLCTVDAAFSAATDPDPNPPEPFADVFAGSGIVVNARVVGGPDTVVDVARRLWRPGMKLIVVTYCPNPDEQQEAYERIHRLRDTKS